jgi:hypothetical protein
MSTRTSLPVQAIRGTIRRRLLVNAVVDPDEAARRLPAGLRPHIADAGTVIGCCLLDIVEVRPARLPAMLGTRIRAAAHRISVEWDDNTDAASVGVYVPTRHTNSRAATLIGGRLFPGVQRAASVQLIEEDERLEWSVVPRSRPSEYGVRVRASVPATPPANACEPIGGTCLNATIGVSPGHHGILEAARMELAHRRAQLVEVGQLDSPFIASFASATLAPSYLMRDVDVIWTPERAPRWSPVEVPA